MDRVVFWIFLWSIPTLSLNKLKLCILFLLFGVPQYVGSPLTPFHDLTLIVLMDYRYLFQLTLLRPPSSLVVSQYCISILLCSDLQKTVRLLTLSQLSILSFFVPGLLYCIRKLFVPLFCDLQHDQ
jgi:hypothetical protein